MVLAQGQFVGINGRGFRLFNFFQSFLGVVSQAFGFSVFFGLVRLTRALLPAMRERRYGKVINVSSVSGRRGLPDHSAYCASKFAVEGWSEALRYEMIPYNVFVALVEPDRMALAEGAAPRILA